MGDNALSGLYSHPVQHIVITLSLQLHLIASIGNAVALRSTQYGYSIYCSISMVSRPLLEAALHCLSTHPHTLHRGTGNLVGILAQSMILQSP